MNSPINSYRDRKIYCAKLISKAPTVYETYQRMLKTQRSLSNLNTYQASIETINKPLENESSYKKFPVNHNGISNQNLKNKKKLIDYHISYIGFLKKNGYTFNNEKRFQWQNLKENSYPVGINSLPRHKKLVKLNKKYNSQKEFEIKRHKKCEPTAYNNNSFNRTKRVIITEFNDKEEDYLARRHKKYPQTNNMFNSSDGGIRYLIKKAPLDFNYRGIKMVKKCKSSDLNLFMNNYAKLQIRRSRKFFMEKDHIRGIVDRTKEHSMDSISKIESKLCSKFRDKLYVNPINWSINNYNSFFYGKN